MSARAGHSPEPARRRTFVKVPLQSDANVGTGTLVVMEASRTFPALHLGPGVTQADRAIEHELVGGRVRVEAEVALPLELHGLAGPGRGQRRLDASISERFERIRIEIADEVGGVRVGPRKQLI